MEIIRAEYTIIFLVIYYLNFLLTHDQILTKIFRGSFVFKQV